MDMLECLNATKRETYIQFEIERKSIESIAANRGLAESTLIGHLEDAILYGLSVNFKRLHITLEDINDLEKKLRNPPINSNISSIKAIKEQVPDVGYGELKIMLALIKKKYGLCREEVKTEEESTSKQATLKIDIPTTNDASPAIPTETTNSPKPRELPNWFKRSQDHDTKESLNQDKEKPKKKPKFM